jgi:hypothetical protein
MRRQASHRLLHSGTGGAESPVSERSIEEAAGDDDSLAALAGRVVSQQEQIARLTSDLDAANTKRAELAKVGTAAWTCTLRPIACCSTTSAAAHSLSDEARHQLIRMRSTPAYPINRRQS